MALCCRHTARHIRVRPPEREASDEHSDPAAASGAAAGEHFEIQFMRHVPRLTERARALLTELNLHYAGVALLLVLVLYLALHLCVSCGRRWGR